jgi:hypothetical protein
MDLATKPLFVNERLRYPSPSNSTRYVSQPSVHRALAELDIEPIDITDLMKFWWAQASMMGG